MNEINVILEGKEYQIDIQKAKELGLLKEQDTRCKSWEEFRNKYKSAKGFHYDSIHNVMLSNHNPYATNEQLTENEAVSINAFSKLLKLRRDWIGDWNPNWHNSESKYCIASVSYKLQITKWESFNRTFSFPTEKMAIEFLNCFKDLFEQCKNLI